MRVDNLEKRIDSIEQQLSGIADLLKELVHAHHIQSEQTLNGFKELATSMRVALEEFAVYEQHTS